MRGSRDRVMSLTLWLAGTVVGLGVLNVLVSLVPKKKSSTVSVAFLPPTITPLSTSTDLTVASPASLKAVQMKLLNVFSRIEDIESRLASLEKSSRKKGSAEWKDSVELTPSPPLLLPEGKSS